MPSKKPEIPKTLTLFRFNLPKRLSYAVTLDGRGEVHGGFQYPLEWIFKITLMKLMGFLEGFTSGN